MFDKTITISGRHSEYANKLKEVYFSRILDVYKTAAIVGCLEGKRVIPEKDDTENRTRISGETLTDEVRTSLTYLFRLVILADRSLGDNEERIDRAFRYETDESKMEEHNESLAVFNEYVNGGIEIMYNKLVKGNEYTDSFQNSSVLYNFMKAYHDDFNHLYDPNEYLKSDAYDQR